MATAADKTLAFDDADGLVKSITTTDDAVSLFNFPPFVGTVTLIISGNICSLYYSQANTLINGLARPAVDTMGRLDIPAVPATVTITPTDCNRPSGSAGFKLGISTTTNGLNARVQAQLRKS